MEENVALSREEQLALPPKVFLDVDLGLSMGDMRPNNNPRVYMMTDDEAVEWNKKQAALKESAGWQEGDDPADYQHLHETANDSTETP